MGKLELEVKVLNIDEKKLIGKIKELGGEFIEESTQYSYTYDLPTIYGRYIECLMEINYPESEIKLEIALERMKNLLIEIENNLSENQIQEIKKIADVKNIKDIINNDNCKKVLNDEKTIKIIKQLKINQNKWIRLRRTNGRIELTLKQLINTEKEEKLQKIIENEIIVNSFEDTNSLLEELGFFHKAYLEKKRKTYTLKGYNIEIDTWPKIPTYMEVEGKDKKDLENILNILGYKLDDAISCTAGGVYEMYGYEPNEFRELKFD